MRQLAPILAAVAFLSLPVELSATQFVATLSNDQVVPGPALGGSGTGHFILSPQMDRLEIHLSIVGLDLDGLQTPNNADDDVTRMHIHYGPQNISGPIVFGLIGPNDDLNGDLVIDPVAGTVVTAWDMNEGGVTLTDSLPDLLDGALYVNVHTNAFPAGAIRGQITTVPEPSTFMLIGTGLAGLGLLRRFYRRVAR